jgi:hypothetical protein
MRELITIKGTQRACLYGLGVLGLLGPSPPAKSNSFPAHVGIISSNSIKTASLDIPLRSLFTGHPITGRYAVSVAYKAVQLQTKKTQLLGN